MQERARAFDQPSRNAFILYLAFAAMVFGRGLVGGVGRAHLGEGPDPDLSMWFLAWWPYALARGLNPLVTDAFWAPSGLNLTWSTGAPFVGLIGAPLTHLFGPVAAHGILCLVGSALSSWTAFLLCRHVSRNYWAAVVGGYVFGFCPTLLGQMLFGRLHSIWVFAVPLIAYAALLRVDGVLTRKTYCVAAATLLVVQFLCSTETFATVVLFGGLFLVLAWVRADRNSKRALFDLGVSTAVAILLATVVVSPYLYYFFDSSPYSGPVWNPLALAGDVLNLVVPTSLNEIGRLAVFDRLSAPFNAGIPAESTAYLNYALVVVALLYIIECRRTVAAPLLRDAAIALTIFSLGRSVVFRGRVAESLALPWRVFQISVYRNVATGRLTMYVYLLLALMAALWLASSRRTSGSRLIAAGLIVFSMMPNLSASYWVTPVRDPAFFSSGLYRDHLSMGETVLILPFWPRNQAMRWQAESQMFFRLAQGCGPWPTHVEEWPIVNALMRGTFAPGAREQLRAYMLARGVDVLIVADDQLPVWSSVVDGLDPSPTRIGGVSLFRMRSTVSGVPSVTAMREVFDRDRFEALIVAARTFLSNGGPRDELLPDSLIERGLIPASAIVGPPAPPELVHPEINWLPLKENRYGIVVFVDRSNRSIIGEVATRESADRLRRLYGAYAAASDFSVSPESRNRNTERFGLLTMAFDDRGLAAASDAVSRAGLAKPQ